MQHFIVAFVLFSSTLAAAEPLGAFTQLTDVGAVGRASLATFDKTGGTYTFSASGDNMWAARDAFGYLWKESRGDVALSARIELTGMSAQGHRKAGVMFRQSLDVDSAYADAVVHGDGLTSLQYRSERGGPTREIQCASHAPTQLRLAKRGDYVQLELGNEDGIFEDSGCVIRIALRGTFYTGLVVCAHDNSAFETALFKHVQLGRPPKKSGAPTYAIELLPLGSLDRKVIYHSNEPLSAASFTVTGNAICFRQQGRLRRLALEAGAVPEIIGTDNAAQCEVAHSALLDPSKAPPDPGHGAVKAWLPRVSPDGQTLAYLAGRGRGDGKKPLAGDYLLRSIPMAGGAPRELARLFGGDGSLGVEPWSADGKQLVFMSRAPE